MAQPYHYTLSWGNQGSFNYHVVLETQSSSGKSTAFKMPAWRPGRYILQNFAGAVFDFKAEDKAGTPLKFEKIDKDTWQVYHNQPGVIRISYKVYAKTLDAGSSYCDPENMLYFNPSTLFMYVDGRLDEPCTLTLPILPKTYKAATALRKTDQYNVFNTNSYHELLDSPTIFSPTVKQFSFLVDNFKCFVYFQGNYQVPDGEEKPFLQNLEKIIRTQKKIFDGDIPADEHHFIYLLLPFNIRHAVEHTRSSMYAMPAQVAESGSALEGLNGISSHEFWHVWNVKSIRPAVLWPYRYDKEVYTTLHWFTEGVTDYYTYLTLVRAGIYSETQYFNQLASTLTELENNPAQRYTSCSHASFESWLGPSNYQCPAAKISFYTLGSRGGLLLDLYLRTITQGKVSLDAVFNSLYKNYFKKNLGVPEDGVQKTAEQLTGQSLQAFFDTYIHGVAPFAYQAILQNAGLSVRVEEDPSPENQSLRRIGVLKSETAGVFGYRLVNVQAFSDAANSGLQDGDVITQINGKSPNKFDWAAIQLNDKLEISVEANGQKLIRTVTFTGQSSKKKVTITRGDNPSPILDSWLKG